MWFQGKLRIVKFTNDTRWLRIRFGPDPVHLSGKSFSSFLFHEEDHSSVLSFPFTVVSCRKEIGCRGEKKVCRLQTFRSVWPLYPTFSEMQTICSSDLSDKENVKHYCHFIHCACNGNHTSKTKLDYPYPRGAELASITLAHSNPTQAGIFIMKRGALGWPRPHIPNTVAFISSFHKSAIDANMQRVYDIKSSPTWGKIILCRALEKIPTLIIPPKNIPPSQIL